MRNLIPLLLTALVAAATFAAEAAEKEDVLTTLQAAEREHAAALAQEHGWSVTEPLIEEAREALSRGDVEAAEELADRALLTAQQSLRQAQNEAEAWRGRALSQ